MTLHPFVYCYYIQGHGNKRKKKKNLACVGGGQSCLHPVETGLLPLLYQQNMHRTIGNDDEHPRDHPQADDILPQSLRVEPECTEDGCSGDLDVQAVFVVDQGQERDFVDDQGLESVVENRQLDGERC